MQFGQSNPVLLLHIMQGGKKRTSWARWWLSCIAHDGNFSIRMEIFLFHCHWQPTRAMQMLVLWDNPILFATLTSFTVPTTKHTMAHALPVLFLHLMTDLWHKTSIKGRNINRHNHCLDGKSLSLSFFQQNFSLVIHRVPETWEGWSMMSQKCWDCII